MKQPILSRLIATRYVDTSIPHIPVFADGLDRDYETLSTTNWMPYVWSVNNVAFAEVSILRLLFFRQGVETMVLIC